MPAAGRVEEVAVLIKAMNLISVLAGEGSCSVARLADQARVSKPSAYRILKTLEVGGYVVHDEARREYSVGPALFGLSRVLRSSSDLLRLSRPLMEELHQEFDETVNIGVVNHGEVVYLDTIESAQRLRSTLHVSMRDHMHSTALGKAILCRLPDAQAEAMLTAAKRPALTPNTMTSVADLMEHLVITRAQGYAIDDEENEVGSRCVAAPIVDVSGTPVASISVSAPTARMNSRLVARVAKRVVEVTTELGKMM